MLKFLNIPVTRILCYNKGVFTFSSVGIQLRSISTTKMSYEKAVEELKNNPFFEQYASKIAQLQKTSPEEFIARLKEKEEKKKPTKSAKYSNMTPLAGQPGNPKTEPTVYTKTKLLKDVMKTELIAGKSPEEIKDIWVEYHKSKDCIAATVPLKTFELIKQRGEQFPIFLLPLPRDQGYEFILCQLSGNEIHFTPLISYQTHKENSPECLTMVYYTELSETKGLVLMKGEFNKDVLTPMEAQCLANELQLYYGEEDEKRTRLLERFTNCPDEFKHMDLIANLETLSLK